MKENCCSVQLDWRKQLKKKKYCMDCIYTSRTAYCYKRHDDCFRFNASDCPFFEKSFSEYTTDESVGRCRLGSLLMQWLKGKTGRKHNNT